MLGGMPMENKDSKRAFNEMYMIALKRCLCLDIFLKDIMNYNM